jgi:hypothetical protein
MLFVWFQLLHLVLNHNRGDTFWWCWRIGVSALLHRRCRHFALDPSPHRPPACAPTSAIRQDLRRGAEVGQHTVSERQQQTDRTAATRRWHQRETHPPCILSTTWCTIGASRGRTPARAEQSDQHKPGMRFQRELPQLVSQFVQLRRPV